MDLSFPEPFSPYKIGSLRSISRPFRICSFAKVNTLKGNNIPNLGPLRSILGYSRYFCTIIICSAQEQRGNHNETKKCSVISDISYACITHRIALFSSSVDFHQIQGARFSLFTRQIIRRHVSIPSRSFHRWVTHERPAWLFDNHFKTWSRFG